MRSIAEKFGLPIFEELGSFALVKEQASIAPYLLVKQRKVLPLEQDEQSVTVAVADPLDFDALNELRLLLKKEIIPVFAESAVIEEAIERCYRQKEEEAKLIFSDLEKGQEVESRESIEGYDLLEKNEQNPVIRIVNVLILEAIQQGSSDLHFEPTENGLSVRYRIDGCLQKRHEPPREYQAQILTRIKVMSKMDIAEHRLPQDGRMKLRHGGREIDFRVSTLPTVYGERIVLRILDKGNILLGLDRIGMEEKLLQTFRKLIGSPEGILLVTGPTGSGKTTTLYSALSEINTSETNIITVEDPVEYKLAGISQVNVNSRIELTFAKGLRHILRQDPDVIMIGEIRDRETAEIAIQASLTGHLVFSTLHTNDAPSAITRLADMGIEPYLLSSSILAVLAQRLIRQNCPSCKEEYLPSNKELSELGLSQVLPLYKGKGCSDCFHTGYKGRCAIYELMPMSMKVKAQALKSQDAEALRKIALQEGMKTLFEQGIELVKQGVTSSTELFRVTREEHASISI
jgi:general secretion pathway protein E